VLLAGGATGSADSYRAMRLAHVHLNVLGWVGLAVVGTQFTLWPTVLRTRMVADPRRAVGWSLPLMAGGLAVTAAGLLTQWRAVALAGLAGYAAGLGVALVPFARTALRRRPHTAASWMLGAGVGWFAGVGGVGGCVGVGGVTRPAGAGDSAGLAPRRGRVTVPVGSSLPSVARSSRAPRRSASQPSSSSLGPCSGLFPRLHRFLLGLSDPESRATNAPPDSTPAPPARVEVRHLIAPPYAAGRRARPVPAPLRVPMDGSTPDRARHPVRTAG